MQERQFLVPLVGVTDLAQHPHCSPAFPPWKDLCPASEIHQRGLILHHCSCLCPDLSQPLHTINRFCLAARSMCQCWFDSYYNPGLSHNTRDSRPHWSIRDKTIAYHQHMVCVIASCVWELPKRWHWVHQQTHMGGPTAAGHQASHIRQGMIS